MEALNICLEILIIFLSNFFRQLEHSESFFHLEEFTIKLENHVFPRDDGSWGEIGVPSVGMVS